MTKKEAKDESLKKQKLWITLSISTPLALTIIFFLANAQYDSATARNVFYSIAFLAGCVILMSLVFSVLLQRWLKLIPIASVVLSVAILAMSVFMASFSSFSF